MESRLPKPSNLKKPTAAFRTIVPSDRLAVQNATSLRVPLSSNLQNFGGSLRRQASPDLCVTKSAASRPKLRRSRSASDIKLQDYRSLAQYRPTLATVQSGIATQKLRRSRSANDLRPLPNQLNKRIGEPLLHNNAKVSKPNLNIPAFSRPPGIIRKLLPKSSSNSRIKPTIVQRPTTSAAAASCGTGTTKKKLTASTKTATSGKRIPAYDFKARFLDLSDRHNALKEKFDKSQEQLSEFSSIQEQLEVTKAQRHQFETELNIEKKEKEAAQRQLQSEVIKSNSLSKSLNDKVNENKTLKLENAVMTKEISSMRPELIELRLKTHEFTKTIDAITIDLTEARELLFRSNMERKELHNTVMDLRGNIRVFCRVRPSLADEETRQQCGWQYMDDTSLEISHNELVAGSRKLVKHEFSFDQVFHPKSRQEDIFELVSPMIQSALDGYNVCIFAYGQTGSGKTFTMDGVDSSIGIIPRTVDLLFETVRSYKSLGWDYKINVTFLEIYNEQLYDLLTNESKEMEIRMVSAKNPTEIYVSNITEIVVESADHLRQLMALAKSNRATASTAGNERSSRSHAVTRMQLIGSHPIKQETCIGTINLVDLAGSESPKTSVRMEETKKINKSLSELTNVIMALLQRQEHIPYRNSKLTHLLMPCLGGNSKTLMFINVAPFQDCFNESVKSLRFAASVNSCKLNKVKKNKFLNTSQVNAANSSHSN